MLHIASKMKINNNCSCAVIYKIQMLLFTGWLQFIPFRDRETSIHHFVNVYFCI